MKWMKYILIATVAAFVLSACTTEAENAFSTAPVAPELDTHAGIIMTANTMEESVVFSWREARFIGENITYKFYAKYNGVDAMLASSTELHYTAAKADFKTTLYEKFTTLPTNTSFAVEFYVVADNGEKLFPSATISVKIYAYGDAVAPVISEEGASVLVFDLANMDEMLELLSWSQAHLTYNEAVTYSVTLAYGDAKPVVVADKLTLTTISKSIDEWNDIIVSTGAPEAQAADVNCTVIAYCNSIPEGVPSAVRVIKVTTYMASFPEKIYVLGNHNGGSPGDELTTIPISSSVKGLYDCYFDLTGTDANIEFKFALDSSLDNAYTSVDYQTTTDDKGNVVVRGALTQTGDNIKVAAGLYRISANLKLKTFEMVKIESMGMIGDATPGGWAEGDETKMSYDAAKKEYSATLKMLKDKEYKFRANANWSWSVGSLYELSTQGANLKFDKEDGEYKAILNVSKHPYTITFMSMSYPEKLYLPGSHQGWSPATAPTLMGDGNGQFEGGVSLVDAGGEANCQFKFTPKPEWGADFGGSVTLQDGIYKGNYQGGDNILLPSAYYYMTVDMTTTQITARPITTVGLIGDFNSWGGDAEFAYANGKWTLLGQQLTANQGFKVRFNKGWDYNRGAGGDLQPYPMASGVVTPVYNNGKNMTVVADGLYDIVLDLSANPNTLTITKK